jgi:radical SAM superfamily enzyme YgiQ (UPF0313 family)
MAPPDFHVELCDEHLTPVNFDTSCDYVGITGYINQRKRIFELAREFRKRGKTVILAGPFPSEYHEQVRPECDIVVIGEAEELAADLFADLRSGDWKSEYVGGKPDLSLSPVPKWSLYPASRSPSATLQTSRGCPFECEFCDVIQYVGRKQRHKAVAQVLREMDDAYAHGFRRVFLADDNFTAYRSRAKELLEGLKFWNSREDGPHKVVLKTQVSIDAARDDEMLRLCSDAGFGSLFIGIETPNEESLKETKKRQNLRISLIDQVQRFYDQGIAVEGGMMVGFDHDGPDIFERQLTFAMESSIPIFNLCVLSAILPTELYARLKKENRLVDETNAPTSDIISNQWRTNIIPKRMTREELEDGTRWLYNQLYSPRSFGERLLGLIDRLGVPRAFRPSTSNQGRPPQVVRDSLQLTLEFSRMGEEENQIWHKLVVATRNKPSARDYAMEAIVRYMQVRHMMQHGQFWDPAVAKSQSPAAMPSARSPASKLSLPVL